MPDSIEGFRYVKADSKVFSEVPKRGMERVWRHSPTHFQMIIQPAQLLELMHPIYVVFSGPMVKEIPRHWLQRGREKQAEGQVFINVLIQSHQVYVSTYTLLKISGIGLKSASSCRHIIRLPLTLLDYIGTEVSPLPLCGSINRGYQFGHSHKQKWNEMGKVGVCVLSTPNLCNGLLHDSGEKLLLVVYLSFCRYTPTYVLQSLFLEHFSNPANCSPVFTDGSKCH